MDNFADRIALGFHVLGESEAGPREYLREDLDPRPGGRGWRDRRYYHEYWERFVDKKTVVA